MLKKLLNTLRHRLDKEEKEWGTLNFLRRELKPGFLYRWTLQVTSKPLLFGVWIIVLVSIFATITALVDSKYLIIFNIPNFEKSDAVAYFSTLWSIQATIAALVYPIVIAFVALMLGQRNNAKATLHIYLHDSAARLAGLSAILLILEMGLQYLLAPYISTEALMIWIVLDGIWFLVNIGLTIHFLVSTFEFIQPNRRFEIMRRYTIAIIWPQEVRYHLARHIFRTAVEASLLPGPAYVNAKNDEPTVFPGFADLVDGDKTVTRNLSNKCQLKDIRFRLLAWATKSWLKKANLAHGLHQQSENSSEYDAKNSAIAFPVEPFATYEGTTTLCRVEGETRLSWFEEILIRLSFVFGAPIERFAELTVNDILMDLQTDCIAFLRSGEPEAFEGNVERLLIFYESLLDASHVLDDSNENTNLMLLSDCNHWLERPVYVVWSRRFFDLFEAATSKLSFGEDYVSTLTYVPNRLFKHAQGKAAPEILAHFIGLNPILFRCIENWWVYTVEQQGQIDHGSYNPTALKPPFYGVHEKVLREFVGAWETLKNHNISIKFTKEVDEKKLRNSIMYLETHLSHTLVMLFDCILRGDRNAAEWFVDVLVKWYVELRFKLRENQDYFLRKPRLLTIEMILVDSWDEIEKRVEIESFGVPGTPKSSPVVAACLNNLWIDTCCIAIYTLAIWNKDCKCDRSLPAHILSALVKGTSLRHGGEAIHKKKPYNGIDELMIAILRQYYMDGHYRRGYRNRLDNYVKKIAELSLPEMVPLRHYSLSGRNDLDSVRDGQLLALLLATPTNWTPSREIERILKEWSQTSNEKLREFKQMLDNWKSRLNDALFLDLSESYDCIRRTAKIGVDFEAAKSSLNRAINHLLKVSTDVHKKASADMPLSKFRLSEIEQWASSEAFTKEAGTFPIPFFYSVMSITEHLPKRSLIMKGMKKGEFTDPLMADRVSNEKEWFAESIRDNVASTALTELLYELKPEKMAANTPEVYWERLKKYANDAYSKGLHPILLLENSAFPAWVWGWVHPPPDKLGNTAPADLIVSKDDNQRIDGYQWTFNGIPVFDANLSPGSSFLVMRESFKSIEFSLLQDGHYITAEPKEVEGHPEIVDLVLSWQMRITTKKYPAIQLSYEDQSN